MKKLKDLDSHEQSVQKLDFCLFQIDKLIQQTIWLIYLIIDTTLFYKLIL